uniref:Soluble interferon alpha/beta receptor OPG204 n=2 Tax=Trichogramma kaykai TaxID=54128 RepID=A0ABD2WSW4_9HYME
MRDYCYTARASAMLREYKDGRPYPWPGSESSFILYPESANQTIYTQEARASDAGRYSCRASNDTTIVNGDITLQVLGEDSNNGYKGRPLPTYKPASQLVALGDTARLFCEAYLGQVYVPDAHNSVTWRKVGENDTVPEVGRVSQYSVSRDDKQVVGSYLVIESVSAMDYGEYVCEISNGIDEEVLLVANIYRSRPVVFGVNTPELLWRRPLLFTILVIFILFSLIALYVRCWMSMALFCRDFVRRRCENDGKDFDAIVCFHEKDSDLATNNIIPTLEFKYKYKCITLELTHLTQHWSLEINPHASNVRRVILIVSPDSINSGWTESSFSGALKQFSNLPIPTIVVARKDPPANLVSVRKNSTTGCQITTEKQQTALPDNVTVVPWSNQRKFWPRIRLAMPTMCAPSHESLAMLNTVPTVVVQTCNAEPARVHLPTSRSSESQQILV